MIKNVQSKIHERKEERTAFDADGAGEDGNFERGKYTPTLRRMEAIAKALGCSVKDLILEE